MYVLRSYCFLSDGKIRMEVKEESCIQGGGEGGGEGGEERWEDEACSIPTHALTVTPTLTARTEQLDIAPCATANERSAYKS